MGSGGGDVRKGDGREVGKGWGEEGGGEEGAIRGKWLRRGR